MKKIISFLPGFMEMRCTASLFTFVLFLTACSHPPSRTTPVTNIQTLPGEFTSSEETQTFNKDDNKNPDNSGSRLIYQRHVDGSLQSAKKRTPNGKIQLNFINAPIVDTARIIIDRALGQSLSVTEGVSGTITLTSPAPVPTHQALRGLDEVLADSGFALVKTPTGYVLSTLSAAKDRAQAFRRAGQFAVGYGVTIVPIEHVSATEISQLIQPLLSRRVTLSVDASSNLLFLRGPQSDVDTAIDAIKQFDTAWLSDRTLALFKLKFASVDDVLGEIESVYRTSGPGRLRSIKFAALPRLNAIFVSARSRAQIKELENWVARFDQPVGVGKSNVHYYQAQYQPASELAQAITQLLKNNNIAGASEKKTPGKQNQPAMLSKNAVIVADETNNALMIKGNNEQVQEIYDLLKQMDRQAPQVLIEATIAEVTLSDDLRFGVQWFWEDEKERVLYSDNADGTIGLQSPGLAYFMEDTNIKASLRALSSVTDVSVLSAPSIMVENNQKASLQVGDQVPIVTQQSQATSDSDARIVSSVELRNTGVILEVTPRINVSDWVSMEINQEVSEVAATTTSGIDSPTIQQRKLNSSVSVRAGKTIALGGLIRETESESHSGIPFLKDIPIIGALFRSHGTTTRRTELIVFITPKIIRSDNDMDGVLYELRDDMRNLSGWLERTGQTQ